MADTQFLAAVTPLQAGSLYIPKFLSTISFCEGTDKYPGTSNHGYDCIVEGVNGSQLFTDYSKHPHILVTVNKAGLQSTAAGRYQILFGVWQSLCKILHVTDFSPLTQDLMCIELLKECHAYPYILQGDIQGAIVMSNHIWASLPGNIYGQGKDSNRKTMSQIMTYYSGL